MFAFTKLMQAMVASGTVSDPQFYLTTLLLSGDGTNGAQNNTFLDSSSNAFSITRNGNTTQGTFTPFSQTGWSYYGDGSTTYALAPNNAAFNQNAAFTLEWFEYLSSNGASQASFYVNTAGYLTIYRTSTGAYQLDKSGTGAMFTSSAYAYDTWHHVALCYDGTNTRMYIDGVLLYTLTGGGVACGTTPELGRGNGGINVKGYISNLRFVKSALYTGSTLTVPTSPLTAVTNTSFLTFQSNRFVDNSTNALTITPYNSAAIQAFSPFAPTAAYSAATVGGSGYFDGTGDYLTGPNASGGDFSTGSFTISCWFYPTTLTGGTNYGLMSYADTGGWNGWQLQVRGSTKDIAFEFLTGSGGASTITGGSIALNAWNFVSIVRSGSTVSMYVNSTTAATSTTNSTAYGAATSRVIVGGDRTLASLLIGYISSAKLVKQADAPASIPTAPDTATTNTSLLLNFTNGGIIDATGKNDLDTVGNAQISTTQSKWGGSSMYFNGTGSYLTVPNNNFFDFGSGNFTIEGWYYPTTSNPTSGLIAKRASSAVYAPFLVEVSGSLAPIFYFSTTGTSWTQISSSVSFSVNTWNHFALTRNGSTFTIWINGNSGGTATNTSALMTNTDAVSVGASGANGDRVVTGYMDDVRITKGYARYTSNFTAPTAAFALQ